jgi:hypothetical protein
MNIKRGNMKKLFFVLSVFILTSSCSRKIFSSKDYLVKETDYVNAFRAFVFANCLNEGTRGNFSKFLEKNNDLGLFSETEIIFHSTAKFADTLGRAYSHKIVPFEYGDGKGKIPNLSECYLYSLSNEIDSIAKVSYRKSLKN